MALYRLLLLVLLALSRPLYAADESAVVDAAERYVRQQTQGLSGKVGISMGRLDVSRLPDCARHQAFSPPGTRLGGKTYIGVRCLGPANWSVLVPVNIAVTGSYVGTARPLIAGQTILADDLVTLTGDLNTLPTGVVTDPAGAVGKTLRNSLGAGQPLRSDHLLAPLLVRQGQSVRVVSKGDGFAVSSEGQAINNAAEGQVAQVRMPSGQTLRGTVKADGSIEIGF